MKVFEYFDALGPKINLKINKIERFKSFIINQNSPSIKNRKFFILLSFILEYLFELWRDPNIKVKLQIGDLGSSFSHIFVI
jgi:hypothetical protein